MPATTPRQRGRRTLDRLARTALFASIRGLAYTLGAAVGGGLISLAAWWITYH